ARRIAKGREAENGRDGKVLWLVKRKDKNIGGREDSESSKRIDFKKRHIFDNLEEGMAVARIYPPHPGKPGENVFNEPVSAKPGNEAKVKFDPKSLSQEPHSDGYIHVKALKPGYVYEDGGVYRISEVYNVDSDVDYSTGSIE